MRWIIRCCILATVTMSAACTQLPVNGPNYEDVIRDARIVAVSPPNCCFGYALVDLTETVTEHAVDLDPGSFYKGFGKASGPAPAVDVGRGDIIQLTVFESKNGGLFIPVDAGSRPGNFVQLPPQVVGNDGSIEVPYAGHVHVAGKSLNEIQTEVEEKLKDRAIEPKVIASFAEQNATTVSVVGEVNTPRKVRLTQGGEHILDMIASAGGIRFPGYEIFVTLQRGGRKQTVAFNSLISHPEENIYARPGDTIYVFREPRRFVVFGAVASGTPSGFVSQQFNFDQEHLSLVEGVARAGGLLDDRANPGMIFLYRLEPRDVLLSMGVDLTAFPPALTVIPTVYRANFRNPATYFFAQRFPLRARDLIYVSNADAVEVTKFLTYVRTISSTAAGVTADAAIARAAGTYIGVGRVNPAP